MYNPDLKIIEGGVYNSNQCGKFEVVSILSSRIINIKFLTTGFETTTTASHIKGSSVYDPLYPTIHGRGYTGIGEFTSKNSKAYRAWKNMFERAYSKNYQSVYPSYKGCSITREWFNYQNFASWFESTYPYKKFLPRGRWELDKDLKVVGNKVYSPDTCVWLPSDINANFKMLRPNEGSVCLVGVSKDNRRPNKYKTVYLSTTKPNGKFTKSFDNEYEAHKFYIEKKNQYIDELAEYYKEFITDEVYLLLIYNTLYCSCATCEENNNGNV